RRAAARGRRPAACLGVDGGVGAEDASHLDGPGPAASAGRAQGALRTAVLLLERDHDRAEQSGRIPLAGPTVSRPALTPAGIDTRRIVRRPRRGRTIGRLPPRTPACRWRGTPLESA